MGNQREIRQVQPTERLGVAILIRRGSLGQVSDALAQFPVGHFYTYVAHAEQEFVIPNMDYGDTNLGKLHLPHFVIQSGGKMWCSYEAFRDHIAAMAPYLEDATFFVGDEEDYIDEFNINNGRLNYQRVHSGSWTPLDEFIRDRMNSA